MIQYTMTEHFEHSAADVYDFVIVRQPENHPRYEPEVIELRRNGPLAVGTKGVMVRRDFGKVTEVPLEMLEVVPGRRARFVADGKGFRFDLAFDIESAGSGADLRVTVQITLSGVMRLFQPLLARKFKKNSERVMQRMLKLMNESSPPQSSSAFSAVSNEGLTA